MKQQTNYTFVRRTIFPETVKNNFNNCDGWEGDYQRNYSDYYYLKSCLEKGKYIKC